MTGPILIVIGVVALFAAIVGGGLKVRDIEVGSVPSKWRQGMLAVFGLLVAFIGLLMWVDGEDAAPETNRFVLSTAPVEAADVNTVPDANVVDANVVDANAADAPPADDTNQAVPAEDNTTTE